MSKSWWWKALAGIAAVIVALAVWHLVGPRKTPPGQPPLVKISPENFGLLRESFNAQVAKTRILALLSPT